MKSDEELMVMYSAGDISAFELLYQRHKGKVYGYIQSKAGSSQADDLFQNVFARLHQKRHLFNPEYQFLPWFFTLIRNVIIDQGRKTQLRTAGLSDQLSPEELGELARETLLEKEAVENLDLDEQNFSLLYQKFVEGKAYKELEKEFGASSSALRQRVSRVLQRIRGKDER